MQNKLWYNNPAVSWSEGLPIGNGRLAAMVWGTATEDRLSLNHEWLWRGIYRNRENNICKEHLKEIRALLIEGDFLQATNLANQYYGGSGGVSKTKPKIDSYQPAGDMVFSLNDVKHYSLRQLDITDAIAEVERTTVTTTVKSSFVAHPIHNLIIGRWKTDTGTFSGQLSFTRVPDEKAVYKYNIYEDKIEFHCSFANGISYIVDIDVKTNGSITRSINSLNIEQASEVIAYLNISTDVKDIQEERERYQVPKDSWDNILRSHREVYNRHLCNFKLDIELPETNIPTDKRVENIKKGIQDPSLVLLFINYGRYLLTACSISAELPANLQGKWNYEIDPPWECDYHFDINLQMNYWMCEAAGMNDCVEVLLKYIERTVPYARKAAKDLYGCRGVCLSFTNDAWGRATPEACGWAVWIGVAPWIAQHFWWHYLYNGDINFLRDRAYPFFKEVAEFYEDYLVEDEKGILQIMPSQSPENRFEGTGKWPVSIGISSAMDVQLAYDALSYAIKSVEILNEDIDKKKHWEQMREKLPSFNIGSDGRLLEWDIERVEVEPGHRHLSHLYGLYPSGLFNPIDRPEQYKASIKSLKERLSHGGGHTGWSRAWVACLYARAGDSDAVWEHLQALLKDFATNSLLDLHPPHIFQIDGNLGAVAAVLEALVQSWGGKTHLLPALPKEWGNGRVKGIKTPGGHLLNMEWKKGVLTYVEITLGYQREILLADIAGLVRLNNSVSNDISIEVNCNDITIKGNVGDVIILKAVH
ncbi:MAG: glycosyl hydrolase family 95 catalytic domain-containing protein [Clostridia bacterium]|jgi:alpha-L-fucosidase 2